MAGPEGEPLPDIQIQVAGMSLFTDREGRFYGDMLPPGEATLQFRDPSSRYFLQSMGVMLDGGETLTLQLTMIDMDNHAEQ